MSEKIKFKERVGRTLYGSGETAAVFPLGAAALVSLAMVPVAFGMGLFPVALASVGSFLAFSEAAIWAGMRAFGNLRRAFGSGGHAGH